MNKKTIASIYKTAKGDAMHRIGWRLDCSGRWKKEIDSQGCGLSPGEQDINRRGGRDAGSDTDMLLSSERNNVKEWLEEFDSDEIEDDPSLRWHRGWLIDAEKEI